MVGKQGKGSAGDSSKKADGLRITKKQALPPASKNSDSTVIRKAGAELRGSQTKTDGLRSTKQHGLPSVSRKTDPTVIKKINTQFRESRANKQMASDGGDLRKPTPPVNKPGKGDK